MGAFAMFALLRWRGVLNPAAPVSAPTPVAQSLPQQTSQSQGPGNAPATSPIPATTLPPLSDATGNPTPANAAIPPPPNLTLPSEAPGSNPAVTPQTAASPQVLKSELGSEKTTVSTPAATIASVSTLDYDVLSQRNLLVPVQGVNPADLKDSFNDLRGGTRRHEAIDITAPRGTPVLAVDDGLLKKLFNSVPGGLTVYQFDRQEIYCYYYAHLDRYADGLKDGMILKRGDLVGYVGTTGDAPANTPHLHFAITKLGPDKHWWQGPSINPYPILNRGANGQR